MSAVSHDEFDDANNRISAQLDDLYRLVGQEHVANDERHRRVIARLAIIDGRLGRLEASGTARFDQLDAALRRIERHLGIGDDQ